MPDDPKKDDPKKDDKPEQPPESKLVEVRVLVDFRDGDKVHTCNSVASFDPATAKRLVKGGFVDDNAEAVKAALALAGK